MAHGDSLGNEGMISSGDVQWMTAGSGIMHQVMPMAPCTDSSCGPNLPAAQNMMTSRDRGIAENHILKRRLSNGATVKIIAGTVAGTTGPISDLVIHPQYADCDVPRDTIYEHGTEYNHITFIDES